LFFDFGMLLCFRLFLCAKSSVAVYSPVILSQQDGKAV